MYAPPSAIAARQERLAAAHQRHFRFLAEALAEKGLDAEGLINKLIAFGIAIKSWAMGRSGTHFPLSYESRGLKEKPTKLNLFLPSTVRPIPFTSTSPGTSPQLNSPPPVARRPKPFRLARLILVRSRTSKTGPTATNRRPWASKQR